MKRIVSGIQATGNLHIGNYLGAMKPWARWQTEGEAFFFIPDLHSLNVRPSAAQLRQESLNNVAWLLATGIDPDQSVIYLQSQISAHAELCWILNNYVTMGELSRMTQYKDKSQRFGPEGQLVGLFAYPVLMAADILLYEADLVPVGQDQAQHVELARDIATRFNKLYGDIFRIPSAEVPAAGGKVMNLQKPDQKMSKSDQDQSGNVMLLDEPDVIRAKFRKAVTDSGQEVKAAPEKPAISNLIEIYAGFSEQSVEEISKKYDGRSYGDFKEELAELVAGEVGQVQSKFEQLIGDTSRLTEVLEEGKAKAQPLAEAKLVKVKTALGLL